MDSNVQDLIDAGTRLFSKRENLMSFFQEIAYNFNPVQADFTQSLTLGNDYASDLMTSYPLLMARELTDQFSSMLRPSDQIWAKMSVDGLKDYEGKAWLEESTGIMRKAMYDRASRFVEVAKAGDRDFGLYGQAVIQVDIIKDTVNLLYRKWHLRDVAWCDGVTGQVESVHRNWKPEAAILARTFGREKLHQSVRDKLDKDPYFVVNCRHIVVPADMWKGERQYRTPLVSLFIDVDNGHVMEETGQRVNSYVIPRWQRIEGTQYACSPATICALPEARLLQAMTFTLLEAGEKYTNPPMLATQEMIRGEIDVRAGGITWVAAEYDERTGEVLRPLTTDKSGMPIGLELQQRSETMIKAAFYLDKLDLPQRGPEMTAYEVGQRVQQYIRNALPLFEPVEVDYNGGLCDKTFELLLGLGSRGFRPIPRSLMNADMQFKFTSPLREAMDKQKGEVFNQASQIIAQAASLDPSAPGLVDAAAALRDTLEGIGVPMPWMRSEEDFMAIVKQHAQAAQQQQVLNSMEQASGVAKNLADAQLGARTPAGIRN